MQSFAGSQEHNRTAHISTRNDYNSWATNGNEHSWVQETWQIMLDSDRLANDTLGARDRDPHSSWRRLDEFGFDDWQNNHAVLRMENIDASVKPGDVKYLEYYYFDSVEQKNLKSTVNKK